MSTETSHKRIAIMVGAGYIPGINAVVAGAALAAGKLGWELMGILDGFEGILHPEKYPNGGLIPIDPRIMNMDPNTSSVLGQSARIDPFNVRTINELEMVEEVDMSDELLKKLKAEKIDAVISIVGGRGMSILYQLHKKGLNAVCVPRSIENDIASTSVSFGFNTALTFTIEMLDRARLAAKAAQKIAVVEVQGEETGWIALQAGIAVAADAVLIPEIPVDLQHVATHLKNKMAGKKSWGLVVVAQGAKIINQKKNEEKVSSLKASLSPLATSDSNSEYVIQKSGQAAQAVAEGLQLRIAEETFPMVIGPWVRGGAPSAVDRQLGVAYGAGAIQALKAGSNGVMVAFVPPDVKFVPLAEAINKVRTIPAESMFFQVADSLGIYVGNREA
jgi:ATP-dependent phosphofructokinase / diphosphate-dependent phosphofructokinase